MTGKAGDDGRVRLRHKGQVIPSPAVSTIAQTIQLSLSPVFMLAGIGALLNVLAGRLSRVVDRARALEQLHPASTGPEHDRHVWELNILDRRIGIINWGLSLAVSSAVMTCTVVALLFVAELAKLHLGRVVAVTFILAMLLLIAALVSFLFEVRASLRDPHPPGVAAMTEKRLLQLVVAIACLVPLLTGGESILRGPAMFGHPCDVPVDLDSHFRYVSGIFFALGIAFATCVPAIEHKGGRFRLLGAMVICGGLARLFSLVAVGVPSTGHLFGLGMELGVVPLLMLWQRSVERRGVGAPPDARE